MLPAVSTLRREDRNEVKSVFTVLGPADLKYVRLHLRRRRFLAGSLPFLAGEPCAGLFLVQRGALRLFIDHAGKEQTLRVVPPGETCNEFVAWGGTALNSAQAIDDSDILILPPAHVSYLIERSDRFARALIATMADRARHYVALVCDLSFRHVTGRVAKVLLQSVSPGPGVGAGSGGRPLTQQELADLVGTAREVAARSLRILQAAGVIAQVRGRIIVLDQRLLEDAVEESCALATRTSSPAPRQPLVFGGLSPVVAPAPQASTRDPSQRTTPPEFEAELAVVAF